MPRPTAQAQSAIEKLKAAGLKRREFRVATERRYIGKHPNTGKQTYEYGDVVITVFSPKLRQLQLARAMAAQGLHVTIYQFEDGRIACPNIMDVHWLPTGVFLEIFGNVDKNGLLIKYKL